MAPGTFDGNVFALQRVFRRRVLLDSESRWLPRIYFVTFRTFAILWPGIELAAMYVLVAILAIGKRQRLFEVATRVAGDAGNFSVTTEQREFRL